jgi:hypothetical protein
MISLKYAVVISAFGSYGAATGFLSSPNIDFDVLHLLKDPEHKQEHWNMVKSSLDELFPGVACGIHIDNSTIRSPPNLITSSIESALMDIHPTITCTGELDEGVLLGGFDDASHVLERRREVPVSFVLHEWFLLKKLNFTIFGTKRPGFRQVTQVLR